MLKFPTDTGSAICTGTFVTDSQVLTAAHCVYDLVQAGADPSNMTFVAGRHVVHAVDLSYNPAYTVTPGVLSSHDNAVVTFPAGSAPAISALDPQEPAVGDGIVIVGYGRDSYATDAETTEANAGAGVKRYGSNKIQQIKNGFISFYGLPTAQSDAFAPGVDSASGSGDSGGPLFVGDKLAATTSGGGVETITDDQGQTQQVKVSKYVDLNDSVNRGYLAQALTASPAN